MQCAAKCLIVFTLANTTFVCGRIRIIRRAVEPIKDIKPWAGILKVKLYVHKPESVTGIILIAEKTALAVAETVGSIPKDILRKAATAIFFNGDDEAPTEFDVKDCVLHDEYVTQTFNTLALLHVEINKDVEMHTEFLMREVNWPSNFVENYQSELYSVGFTDDYKGVFKEIVKRMTYVDNSKCVNFYINEGINFKTYRPVSFGCYKDNNSCVPCVYESGMALVTNSSGQWTLLGISFQGPGCSLPARFIDIYSYIPWITENSFAKKTRRYSWETRVGLDDDSVRLNDPTATWVVNDPQRVTKGICSNETHIVYQEKGQIDMQTSGVNRIVYSVSLYDLRFDNITCVELNMSAVRRSEVQIIYHKGFNQDDFDDFIVSGNLNISFTFKGEHRKDYPSGPGVTSGSTTTRTRPRRQYSTIDQSFNNIFWGG